MRAMLAIRFGATIWGSSRGRDGRELRPQPTTPSIAGWRPLANATSPTSRMPELTRALRALSSIYVERRSSSRRGDAIGTAGKRAAFALFYGPLHFSPSTGRARSVARRLTAASGASTSRSVDLGCGTGAAGGGVGARATGARRVEGYDINAWAARRGGMDLPDASACAARHVACRSIGSSCTTRARPIMIVAYVLNELPGDTRERMRRPAVRGGPQRPPPRDRRAAGARRGAMVAGLGTRRAGRRRPRRRVALQSGVARVPADARQGRRPRSSGAHRANPRHRLSEMEKAGRASALSRPRFFSSPAPSSSLSSSLVVRSLVV